MLPFKISEWDFSHTTNTLLELCVPSNKCIEQKKSISRAEVKCWEVSAVHVTSVFLLSAPPPALCELALILLSAICYGLQPFQESQNSLAMLKHTVGPLQNSASYSASRESNLMFFSTSANYWTILWTDCVRRRASLCSCPAVLGYGDNKCWTQVDRSPHAMESSLLYCRLYLFPRLSNS